MKVCLVGVIILCLVLPVTTRAKEFYYNHDSETISQIQKQIDFHLLTPENIPEDWTLEIKTTTAPWIGLHFMDQQDTKLMVWIHQKKGTNLDGDFSRSEQVDINGYQAFFTPWANSGELDKRGEVITGGVLDWVQGETVIDMYSTRISKEKMLEIARSLR